MKKPYTTPVVIVDELIAQDILLSSAPTSPEKTIRNDGGVTLFDLG